MAFRKNTNEANNLDFLYVRGDEETDGSLRLTVVQFANKDVVEIQRRTDGLWAATSFKTGPNSLIVGNLISLAAAGNSLITEDKNGDSHFHVRSGVSSGVTTDLANIVHASAFFEEAIFFGDTDGEFTGTSIEKVDTNTAFHLITQKFYFKTGSTAATEAVRVQSWDGSDDTGTLIFDQSYPASTFTANSDLELDLDGFLEFELGASTFTRISSDATFSLLTDSTVTDWYLAVDFSVIQNDDILQTNEWISGNTFTEGVWSTQDRKVYVCNVTGTQSGTFTSNIDKWDLLLSGSDFDNVLTTLDANIIVSEAGNLVTI